MQRNLARACNCFKINKNVFSCTTPHQDHFYEVYENLTKTVEVVSITSSMPCADNPAIKKMLHTATYTGGHFCDCPSFM